MLNLPEPENSRKIDLLVSRYKKVENQQTLFFDVEEFLDLIEYYLTNESIKSAFIILNKAIKIYPNNFELKITEAQLLIESGLYSQASKKLKILFEEAPEDFGLLMLIGINYAKSGIINKSLQFFDKAIALVQDTQLTTVHYSISQIFIQIGRYDIASYHLSKAYNYSPEEDSIILDLAFCFERSEKNEKSKKLHKIYLQKNPFSELAWYNLGVVYSKLGLNEDAINAFDFAIAIEPTFSSPVFNKANILFETKRYTEAIDNFSKVIAIETSNASAIYFRGMCYLGNNNLKNALNDFQNSLKIQNNQPLVWFEMANVYLKLAKNKLAKKAIYNALKIEKLNSKFWALAAKILIKEKKYKFADKAYMHAISFDPFEDTYWFDYSDYKKKMHDFEEAISVLKMSKEFVTDTLSMHLKLSSLYLLNNDNNNAILSFKSANEINPNAINRFSVMHPNKKQLLIIKEKQNN